MLKMLLKFLYLKRQSVEVFKEKKQPRIIVNIHNYQERTDMDGIIQKRDPSK